MKTSLIKFYAVGLNEQNLAFNLTAFNNILRAGRFLQGNVERSITLNQPVAFGAPFQISAQYYYIFKKATYLLIQNTVDNRTYSRYGFINNFLELANGNYSVSYTLDDYTNYILHASDLGVSPHIDGFTERANVPLIEYKNRKYVINTTQTPLTGTTKPNLIKRFYYSDLQFLGVDRILPTGWKCQIYSIDIPKYDGNATAGAVSHGYITDYLIKTDEFRLIERLNSNLYLRVFDENGKSVAIVHNDFGTNKLFSLELLIDLQHQTIIDNPNYGFNLYDSDDSTIIKIMTFDGFIPCIDGLDALGNLKPYWNAQTSGLTNIFSIKTIGEVMPQYASYQGANRKILYVNKRLTNQNAADIFVRARPNVTPELIDYHKAAGFSILSTTFLFELPNTDIYENSQIIKRANYDDYLRYSLYRYIDEYRKVKIKFLTAELEVPQAQFVQGNKIYVGFSGDLETVYIKYASDLPISYKSNDLTATGQNTAYFDLVHVRDFKAYKNAKISGAAGIAASLTGGLVSFGASAASVAGGNIAGLAGMVGSLAGVSGNIISNIQKLQGLTPSQQSPANGDYTLTQIITDYPSISKLLIEISTPAPEMSQAVLRDMEENGAAVSMPFDEYINNCQMEAYNAIKCAYMDITGIPQQAARRIADAFISGLTLWTATDVGNKKVINYPAE